MSEKDFIIPMPNDEWLSPTPGYPEHDPIAHQFQHHFPASEFAARRERIYDSIGCDAAALLQGTPPVAGYDVPRQTNEFFYCSGIEIPQAYILMRGTDRKIALYVPAREKELGLEGAILGSQDGEIFKQYAGIDETYGLDKLAEHLAEFKTLYTLHTPAEGLADTRGTIWSAQTARAADPWEPYVSRENRLNALLQTRYPRVTIKDITPIIDELRSVKSPKEVEILRKNGRLCGLAVNTAMRACKPGMSEYQLGAIAEYIYRLYGAVGDGYRPIIGSGKNIWYIHYYQNNCIMRDGDLVIYDGAPEILNYTSDIGRIWPINGTYTPLQRELCGIVTEYHKTLLSKVKPGKTHDQVMKEAAEDMAKVMDSWKFSKDIYEAGARRLLDFRGHLSHPVGMSVHDDGSYYDKPMVPGMVFSIDPQMWIPEEKIYLRCEDTIAVTEDGIEILTAGCPTDLDDVEKLMREEPVSLFL